MTTGQLLRPTQVQAPEIATTVQYMQVGGDGRRHPLAAVITGYPTFDPPEHVSVHLVVFTVTGFFFAHSVPHESTANVPFDGTWRHVEQPAALTIPEWFTTSDANVDTVNVGKPQVSTPLIEEPPAAGPPAEVPAQPPATEPDEQPPVEAHNGVPIERADGSGE